MLKVTVLAENSAYGSYRGEHGLSLYIENDSHKILLDAGQSSLFIENAAGLGIDLAQADIALLSHAHYDHADGFVHFLKINNKAKLYKRKEAWEFYYSHHQEGMKYIGPAKGMFSDNRDRIVVVDKEKFSFDNTGMFLVSHSTPNLSFVGEKAGLYKSESDILTADDFAHEQTFVIRTEKGLVIFNSCSHAGPENIIREVLRCSVEKRIYAYIGGFHLSKYPDEEISEFAKILKDLEIERIITGHCTGDKAFELLREHVGGRIEKMHAGMQLIL